VLLDQCKPAHPILRATNILGVPAKCFISLIGLIRLKKQKRAILPTNKTNKTNLTN
jgi:hypothetical protein